MMHGTAATVVLLRDSADGLQVLLLERPRHRGSFAGAWVFPGGLVDPQDAHGGNASGADADDDVELAAARRAGVRETAEETGLALAAPDLVRLSRWVPPPEAPRRYRTEFFLAKAPAGEVVLSPDEHVASAWLTPSEAFRRQREGTMDLVPPTWVTLHGLLHHNTVAEALEAAAAAAPETFATRQLSGREPLVMVWAGDAEYPDAAPPETAGRSDPARRHRLVLGTGGWSYQRSR
ncbi:NUDIX domain-containing protein [Arthrobacter sp. zg-ZUI100]|uniref:NUDIX hydrolase n=1 Tax=Arthrobacter jiangjiafuii TaxID=2817475 RepID=UPI001AEDC356|nr:NUDIX domain-containing protein [Arthrobacter jiangjiafuii]MBP3035442.1 NUDIX domain-containing protein [Arthrobacter jiangjiafuii]